MNANKQSRICLVTGASSGIGYATAAELLGKGYTVYAAARRVEKMEPLRKAGARLLALDISNPAEIERAVETVLAEQGRIDILVNNAGIGIYGAVEDVPLAQARHLFEVNIFGLVGLTQHVLPAMRKQGTGTIVNISSVGGEVSIPLGSWYYATKHALEAISDALRQEVKPFGIQVIIIQPGIIKTEFQQEAIRDLMTISAQGAYRSLAEAMIKRDEQAAGQVNPASDPAVVARVVRKAIETAPPRPRYPAGYLAGTLLRLHWLLPEAVFEWLIRPRP